MEIPKSLHTPVFHELVQILLHVLKYKVEVIIFPNYLLKLDHVSMVQLL